MPPVFGLVASPTFPPVPTPSPPRARDSTPHAAVKVNAGEHSRTKDPRNDLASPDLHVRVGPIEAYIQAPARSASLSGNGADQP